MVLARPQETKLCGVRPLPYRLLQQPQILGSEHDEMWPLSCGNGLPPPGAQAGDEGVLTRHRCVLVRGDPDVRSLGRFPLDAPVQAPDAKLLVSWVAHHMHEDGRADIAWIERRRFRQHLQAIVSESTDSCSKAGNLLRTQDVLMCRAFLLPPACGVWQRRQPQVPQLEVFSRRQVGE